MVAVLGAASKIVDTREWPLEERELAVFGAAELQIQADHFRVILEAKGCDIAMARHQEWTECKVHVRHVPPGPAQHCVGGLSVRPTLCVRTYCQTHSVCEDLLSDPLCV